jgi:xanthine dehydrogenase accessory factor
MTGLWDTIRAMLAEDGRAVLVTITAVAGSSPREVGARMAVRADGAFSGTIGGGALEWELMQEARLALAGGQRLRRARSHALGPELGQCCGGRVTTELECFARADLGWITPLAEAERRGACCTVAVPVGDGPLVRRLAGEAADTPARATRADGSVVERFGPQRSTLLLFGAGHVGRALVLSLAPLPFAVRWIDERAEAFPAVMPANVTAIRAPAPEAEVAHAPAGAMLLVLTHSHARDLAIVAQALPRADLALVGLIGSATKRARFLSRLAAMGLDDAARARLTCPIGLPGITNKAPAVIAASVTAQLLMRREAMADAFQSEAVPA